MWAELVVAHDPIKGNDSVKEALIQTFGDHDEAAHASSEQFSESGMKTSILYSRTLASYRVLCMRDGDNELVLYIESIRGSIFQASQSAWQKVRRALANYSPSLVTADVVEAANTSRFLSGKCTTFMVEFRKRESVVPFLVGLATLAYFLAAIFSFGSAEKVKYTQGAVAGVVSAAVVLILVVVETRKGSIRWNTEGVQ